MMVRTAILARFWFLLTAAVQPFIALPQENGFMTGEAERYLVHRTRHLLTAGHSYVNLHQVESPGGHHLTYQAFYQGVPVYDAIAKVNMDRQLSVRSVFYHFGDMSDWHTAGFPARFPFRDGDVAAVMASRFPGAGYAFRRVYYQDAGKPLPAVLVELHHLQKGLNLEIVLGEGGRELERRDMNRYFMQDSVALGLVFMPDPLTTAGVVYGAPYLDSGDADVAELNAERDTVPMTVTFLNDTFYLAGQYAQIVDLDAPFIAPAFSLTPDFFYQRASPGFEDVNAYYHIHAFQLYIRSLGFTNLADYQIRADTHGNGGNDNSYFSASPFPVLVFGEGGVDDAEDADVIVHEYGHAISYSAAPSTNSGMERNALEEGICDYLAASYSGSMAGFSWEKVFTWDGHNEYWGGRNAASAKHYPEDLGGDYHLNGEIWSSVLMEIWGTLGRDTTDKLAVQSLYSWSAGLTMQDAAILLLQADTLLFGGMHHDTLCYYLSKRGLLDSACAVSPPDTTPKTPSVTQITVTNSYAFMENAGALSIALPDSSTGVVVELFDMAGRLAGQVRQGSDDTVYLAGDGLARGLYMLRVRTDKQSLRIKIARLSG